MWEGALVFNSLTSNLTSVVCGAEFKTEEEMSTWTVSKWNFAFVTGLIPGSSP